MTEKELLYVEDGIHHENSMISILKDTELLIKDKELQSFLRKQRLCHEKMKEELLNLLEDFNK